MASERQALNVSASTVLNASGGGRVELGPDRGVPYWNVTKYLVKTSRPGLAPVPACSVYVDFEDPDHEQDSTYDGSKDASDADIDLSRGQHIIAVWSGGQAGDTATLSLTGWKGER